MKGKKAIILFVVIAAAVVFGVLHGYINDWNFSFFDQSQSK